MDDLVLLHTNEQIMLAEADEWYSKWRMSLEKFGASDKFWTRIIEITEEFAEKYADTPCRDYAKYLMISRVNVLDAEWRNIRNAPQKP